jgi:hypothetical protein
VLIVGYSWLWAGADWLAVGPGSDGAFWPPASFTIHVYVHTYMYIMYIEGAPKKGPLADDRMHVS